MTRKGFYKRGWHHTKKRGKELTVTCGFCGRKVPKYKTFSVTRGFRITDPMLRKEIGRFPLSSRKMYACPACARFHKVVRQK